MTESSPIITRRQKFIFGLGSAFLLSTPAYIFIAPIANKILGQNLSNQIFIITLFVLFFIVGYFSPHIFLNYFTVLLNNQGASISKKDFEDVPQFQWRFFMVIALLIGCFLIGIEFFI